MERAHSLIEESRDFCSPFPERNFQETHLYPTNRTDHNHYRAVNVYFKRTLNPKPEGSQLTEIII